VDQIAYTTSPTVKDAAVREDFQVFSDPTWRWTPWRWRSGAGKRTWPTSFTTPIAERSNLSIRYTERLEEAGIAPSVGSAGDSYDNALAESLIGLYRGDPTTWTMEGHRRSRVRHARVGGLVQPSPAGRADRSRPAGGVRGRLPSEGGLKGRRGTQRTEPPVNPGRFSWMATTGEVEEGQSPADHAAATLTHPSPMPNTTRFSDHNYSVAWAVLPPVLTEYLTSPENGVQLHAQPPRRDDGHVLDRWSRDASRIQVPQLPCPTHERARWRDPARRKRSAATRGGGPPAVGLRRLDLGETGRSHQAQCGQLLLDEGSTLRSPAR
jgi:hypothetical protein